MTACIWQAVVWSVTFIGTHCWCGCTGVLGTLCIFGVHRQTHNTHNGVEKETANATWTSFLKDSQQSLVKVSEGTLHSGAQCAWFLDHRGTFIHLPGVNTADEGLKGSRKLMPNTCLDDVACTSRIEQSVTQFRRRLGAAAKMPRVFRGMACETIGHPGHLRQGSHASLGKARVRNETTKHQWKRLLHVLGVFTNLFRGPLC
mmetsp:Transcript_107801/g.182326  ORF Transcript_107801/g.182326 Transcript_107801/m.182326 type:complete len:202 (+) Transcript_107801:351-956(+)